MGPEKGKQTRKEQYLWVPPVTAFLERGFCGSCRPLAYILRDFSEFSAESFEMGLSSWGSSPSHLATSKDYPQTRRTKRSM